MTYTEIIDQILGSKLKNGKPVVNKPEHVKALETIRDFDVQKNWIESKDLTKYSKIVGSYILKVYPEIVPQNNPEYKGYGVYVYDFTPKQLLQMYERGYEKYDDKNPKLTEQIFNSAKAKGEELFPLGEHMLAMEKRVTRGGKLPKSEREKQEREAIKGALNPQLKHELERLKEKWKVIIYDATLEWLQQQRELAAKFLADHNYKLERPKSQSKEDREEYEIDRRYLERLIGWSVVKYETDQLYRVANDAELEKEAMHEAVKESESFYFKMADKLGGLVMDFGKQLKSVTDWETSRKTPFESSIRFEFTDGSRFDLDNSIVKSHSVYGNPFFRYPALFSNAYNAKGEKIANPDEYNVKAAFMRDAGLEKMPKSAFEKIKEGDPKTKIKQYYEFRYIIKYADGSTEHKSIFTDYEYHNAKDLLTAAILTKAFVPKGKIVAYSKPYGHKRRGVLPENTIQGSSSKIANEWREKRDNEKNNPPQAEAGVMLPTGKEVKPDNLPEYNEQVGGYLAGVNDQGQVVLHEDGEQGGMLVGRRHSEQGGIKAINEGTNQPILVETGEVSICAEAVMDKTKREFDGEMLSNREILSRINRSGGGVDFAKESVKVKTSSKHHSYRNKEMSEKELFELMDKEHNK